MEGLFSLLVFAGLFYVMMRFGCGAHMVHGHGGHGGHRGGEQGEARHEQHAPVTSRAIDPVCGMEVAPDKGYTKMYEERQYRLCSRACLDKFEANPQQYATAAGGIR
jgi:YHS domain-containing protein